MARPLKQGLDYFPLDTDFLQDIKVRRLIRACGSSAIPMLIGLLVNIYRGDGYYLRWDSDMTFLISDEVGISEGAEHRNSLTRQFKSGFSTRNFTRKKVSSHQPEFKDDSLKLRNVVSQFFTTILFF
ncbi:hypothetical protein HMPREF0080_02031 [Anaeroglobus geminatus F0357]|uniref:Lin1244/Lin1753-like N-terminal domain-containing protein n=1 Tax=Anaeroglobus geminatus F0357 TaxID=861450 RepID=G9YK22_9FIRM|nr:DUF4373 domain-containing protein [Anaeroglobus geminatus]EHM37847.1 hypothetical protein HMPREF0080_02031 [Anaeroglobus geminatus F0357]